MLKIKSWPQKFVEISGKSTFDVAGGRGRGALKQKETVEFPELASRTKLFERRKHPSTVPLKYVTLPLSTLLWALSVHLSFAPVRTQSCAGTKPGYGLLTNKTEGED